MYKRRRLNGSVTVMSALIFGILIMFMSALLSALMIEAEKNMRRIEMHLALDSAFAEYNRRLFEKWDLFAIDMTYGQTEGRVTDVLERIRWYGEFGDCFEEESCALLTDREGENFLRQAEAYAAHVYKLDIPEKILELSEQNASSYIENTGDILREMEEMELPDISLPKIPVIDEAFLRSLVPGNISDKTLNTEALPSRRTLQKGSMPLKRGNFEKTGLMRYTDDHFGNYRSPGEGVLAYEKEYLVAGRGSDRDNLLSIVRRIMVTRFPVNMYLIMGDEGKKAKAAAFATGVTVVAAAPYLEEALKYAILVVWAFIESGADTKTLMEGEKIPYVKHSEDWITDIHDIFSTGQVATGETEEGFDCL